MAKLLKLRRGTTSQHGSFTGAEGEVTIDTDKEVPVVHDGSTAGGHPVAAEDMANVSSANIAGRLGTDSIATTKIAAGALPTDVTVTNDNVVSNAAVAGTKIAPDFGSQNLTTTGSGTFASLDISGNADIDGTMEADAYTVDGTALNEYIADTIGAMVGSNTETGITVTYEDSDNTLDFVIGTLNQDTTGTADHVKITDNESTAENNQITFVEGANGAGNYGLEVDGDFHYNPNTGTCTATAFAGNLTGNVTGNTSGTAATVTTAAQPNITSTGTLTGLTISGDLTLDSGTNAGKDITWDESASEWEFTDGVKVYFGTGGDLLITHDGNNSKITENGTGSLAIGSSQVLIESAAHDETLAKFIDDGACEFYYDNSKKLETVTGGVDVTGALTASGNVTAFSDARLKTDVSTIENALDKVTQLRGVNYTKTDTQTKGIGVIAQEVEKVLPEVVQDGAYKSVAYGNIVGVLIEAIKELKSELDEHKKRTECGGE